ncbi:MAG TPA: hypothetical protein VN515_07710 [Terriglobales bacterium]|nr:hypothetical protein [Terriglobales bacterium]
MQTDLAYEVVLYKADEWAAEANDLDSGESYRVLFIGPNAEARAREYANWQNAARKAA